MAFGSDVPGGPQDFGQASREPDDNRVGGPGESPGSDITFGARSDIGPDDLSDPLRDMLLQGAIPNPFERGVFGALNALSDRFLGFRQDPAVQGGRAGFQATGNLGPLGGPLGGILAALTLGPEFGQLAKRAIGAAPDFPLGFSTLEEIAAMNAARGFTQPGDVEGGQQLSFDDPAPALAQFGAGGGLPAGLPGLPQAQGAGFAPSEPGAPGALPETGLPATMAALQGFERDRVARALADRLTEEIG